MAFYVWSNHFLSISISVIGKSDDFFANVSLLFLNTHKISANNNVIINKCKNELDVLRKISF